MKEFVKQHVEKLLESEGLVDRGWSYKPNQDKRRLGVCNYEAKTIGISIPLVTIFGKEEALQVIRHEIAHAIVGSAAGHGSKWRLAVSALGGLPKVTKEVEGVLEVDPWVGECSEGHKISMAAAPRRVKACSSCSDTFKLKNILRWSKNGAPMTPKEIGGRYFKEYKLLEKLVTTVHSK